MIYKIEVKGLRALRYVSVVLDSFLVMVGPNASGKSTLFDALLLVRDVLSSGLDAAVYGNTRMNIAPRAPDALDLTWLRQGGNIEIAITLKLPDAIVAKLDDRYHFARYELALEAKDRLGFEHETLWLCKDAETSPGQTEGQLLRLLFPEPIQEIGQIITLRNINKKWRKVVSKVVGNNNASNDYFRSETTDWNNTFRLGPSKSALSNLPEDEERFPASTWVKRILLEGIHRLSLNAEKMRLPSPAGSPIDFLADGSNLPWVVHALENTPELKRRWVEHIATSLTDVVDVTTVEKPENRSRYIELHYSSGLRAPSWVLSDGTLRLLALTLLAYAPKPPALMLIEEPENGIHPKAMETVMQSLESVYDSQILCATHSPIVLSQLDTSQIMCFGKNDDGAIDIVRGNEHPQLREWKSALNLGDLLAAGILG